MARIKKVLLTGWGSNGGADEVVYSLAEGLLERGVYPTILFPDKCVGFNGNKYRGRPENILSKPFMCGYDILHCHECYHKPQTLDRIRLIVGNPPLVYTAHSILINEIMNHPQNRKFREYTESLPEGERKAEVRKGISVDLTRNQEHLLDNADRVIFLTDNERCVHDYYYPPNSKARIIPNGSGFYKFVSERRVRNKADSIRKDIEKHTGGNSRIVLYTGRFLKEKGVEDLAMAFDKISERFLTGLVLIGEGDKKPVLNKIRPAYRKNVLFSEWVHDRKTLASYYMAADVFVMPSYFESFGLSILEAAMSGTPVIASNIDGPEEIFVKPMLAYGVNPGNVDGLVHWLDFVFSNPENCKENAERVQKVVSEKYSIDRNLERTLDLYNEVIEEGKKIKTF